MHLSFVIGSSVWVYNDVTDATWAAKMITLSRTPDFTPFGEFNILAINDIYITEFVSFRIMFTNSWLWFVCLD